MFVDLADMNLDADTITFDYLESEGSGGGFYANNWRDVIMKEIIVTQAAAPT